MSANYINIPGAGDAHWKTPVSTASALPPVGNQSGDARITLDTDEIYIWNGSTWVEATGGGGGGVSSLNSLTGAVVLDAGTGITLTPSGNSITIATSGGSPSIGGPLTGATTGSVIFAGAGVFAQDNANFFWDDTNHWLGIGTITPNNPLGVGALAHTQGITLQGDGSANVSSYGQLNLVYNNSTANYAAQEGTIAWYDNYYPRNTGNLFMGRTTGNNNYFQFQLSVNGAAPVNHLQVMTDGTYSRINFNLDSSGFIDVMGTNMLEFVTGGGELGTLVNGTLAPLNPNTGVFGSDPVYGLYPFQSGYIGTLGLHVGIGSGATTQYPSGDMFDVYSAAAAPLFTVDATGNATVANSLNLSSPQTTLTGTTGTAVCSQPFQGSSYKKVVVYFSGYTETGTQTYTYPTAFVNTPYVYGLSTAVSASTATTTSVTFVSVGALSGFIFIEGY
jgi:hypothetical protein